MCKQHILMLLIYQQWAKIRNSLRVMLLNIRKIPVKCLFLKGVNVYYAGSV